MSGPPVNQQAATASISPTPPSVAAVADRGASSKINIQKRDELLASMRQNPSQLVVVTGTGVTIQSVGGMRAETAVAGWQGLLASGLERCRRLNLIDEDDADVVTLQIGKRKSEHLINAAQKIHECLDKRTNERQQWMKDTIGSLTVTDPRLIKAILALDGLVATLNYDTTIYQVSGRRALHWRQQGEITECIKRRSKDFTLHLHGLVEDLKSIVLDRTSYDEITSHVQMQDLLRKFARWETMLFIGCRNTFLDPNFTTLLGWAKLGLAGIGSRHFVLCRADEEDEIISELQPHGYLTPLVYGEQHSDLAPFLEALAIDARGVSATANPPTLVAPSESAPTNAQTPLEIWTRQTLR